MRHVARRTVLAGVCIMSLVTAAQGAGPVVAESPRKIPVAYDVDVVVVGGSSAGVAAAVAAAKGGARVFLAADRPYLGADMCATYRLWLEPGEEPASALAKSVFVEAPPAAAADVFDVRLPKGLTFTYEASIPSSSKHKDTRKATLLRDGKCGSASSQSVQYDGDVTITADLGKVRAVGTVHVRAYQRVDDFEVMSVAVSVSDDAKVWREVSTAGNKHFGKGGNESGGIDLAVDVSAKTRYVRFGVTKGGSSLRVLLGEIVIEPQGQAPAIVPERAPVPKAPTVVRRRPPTPMQIKRALDVALLDAKVDFLYGCYVTDVLRDADGKLAGIVIANRAGRQAVRAKVIIDATPRATVARIAGAKRVAFPAGPQTFKRVVVGGKPTSEAGKTLDVEYASNKGAFSVTEYTLTIPMKDNTFASYAHAEKIARDKTWQAGQIAASEYLFQIPPDPICSRKPTTREWAGADTADLDAFRPAVVDRLYVLSGCASVSRAAAAKMMRPLAMMAIGERVGKAAAGQAAGITASPAVTVSAAKATANVAGDIHEFLTGVRPMHSDSQASVVSPARSVPVIGEYDVVVIGGGTSGAPAGIAAGRRGAKTLVIEYLYGLGGVGTTGRIGKYYHGYRKGFTAEIDRAVGGGSWDIQTKMDWYRKELGKAGVDVWFLTLGCGALVDRGTVKGAVIATPNGRGVVLAKVVIDATGSADVAAAAGAECVYTDGTHVAVQGTGLPPRDPGAKYTNTDWTFSDDTDMLDMWRMFVVAKTKYPDAFDLGQLIDTRERRRIVGMHLLSPLDIITKHTFPDSVVLCDGGTLDSHGFTTHPLFKFHNPRAGKIYTPYRSLIPIKLDGLIAAGLGLSAHRDAVAVIRMQPDVQNQGYAAGVAAAMAAQSGVQPRDVDVKALQRHLVEKGNLPEEVLTHKDSYPIPRDKILAAVETLPKDYAGIAVVLAQPGDSIPMMRKAYAATMDKNAKLAYAHVLGMLGDRTGVETLIAAIKDTPEWDKGWAYRGMGQFGWTLSRLDSLILALGKTGDKRGLPVIIDKLKGLTITHRLSHHRNIAVALETIGDKSAAAPLAVLLKQPGMTGHAFIEIRDTERRTPASRTDVTTRERSLVELTLARALYRCGDHESVGKTILMQYARDLRGHYARHACAVLREGERK